MPVFIYPQPGGNPIASFIIGVAALAIFVGLVIFFLPLIAGIVVAILLLGLAFWVWNWFKRKFGMEDEETRMFRETMEQAEAAAREQYRDDGGVWVHEEIRTERIGGGRRRNMKDVEDIEETK